jgi:hypothetical protein
MFNPPAADLHSREPLIYTPSTTAIWYRSHKAGRNPGDYGVLNLGTDERCAFMESIRRGLLRTRFVPASQLKALEFSKIRFSMELRLVDLVASAGLTRLGAAGSLANGLGYRNSQKWSEALRSHPTKPDGIYYRSRYDPPLASCALYDHSQPFVEVVENCGTGASQPVLLGSILDHYQFGTDL